MKFYNKIQNSPTTCYWFSIYHMLVVMFWIVEGEELKFDAMDHNVNECDKNRSNIVGLTWLYMFWIGVYVSIVEFIGVT